MANLCDASDVAEPGTPRSPGGDSFTAEAAWSDWSMQLLQLDDEAAADLLAEMEPSHAVVILRDIEMTKAARCLAHMKAEVSAQIFKFMSADAAVMTLKSMRSHESAGIINEMSAELAAKILEEMEPVQAGDTINDMPGENVVGILSQMSSEVVNEILREMDVAARNRLLAEMRRIFPNWSVPLRTEKSESSSDGRRFMPDLQQIQQLPRPFRRICPTKTCLYRFMDRLCMQLLVF